MKRILSAADRLLACFINPVQLRTIHQLARGEEGAFFVSKMKELSQTFTTMPKPYKTDGQGDDAVAVLHYFGRGGDWYIVERDSSDEQHQAFGVACLSGEYPEKGYISIAELLESGVELDLHWTPKKLCEIETLNPQAEV